MNDNEFIQKDNSGLGIYILVRAGKKCVKYVVNKNVHVRVFIISGCGSGLWELF